jgi:nucleoside-diphosphate-sugar epimerase
VCSFSRTPAQGEWFAGDLRDLSTLREACSGVDAVIHAAGLAHRLGRSGGGAGNSTELYQASNVEGVVNAFAAALAAGVRNLVLLSSSAVYGHGRVEVDENADPAPTDIYGESKLRGEQRARELISRSGGNVSLTILRPAAIVGPGDPGNILRVIRAIDTGRFVWIGGGKNRKSLISRSSVAEACLDVAQAPEEGVRILNLATDHLTVETLVEMIARELGRGTPRMRVPEFPFQALNSRVWRALEPPMMAPLRISVSKWLADATIDGSLYERTFRYSSAVSLRESLAEEVRWYREGCAPGA